MQITDHTMDIDASVRQASPDRTPARRVLEGGAAPDPVEWERLVSIGLPSLALPEALGGVGFGIAEQVAAAQVLGAMCTTIPFTAMMVAANILARSERRNVQELVDRLASGAQIVGALLPADGDGVATLSIKKDQGSNLLSGSIPTAFEAASLDVLLIHIDGEWWAVEAKDAGVEKILTAALDASHRLTSFKFTDVPAVLVGELDLSKVLSLAWTLVAAQASGVAEAALEMAKDYAAIRRQFDQPIGRFQAIKHKLTDMLIQVEAAKSAVQGAVRSASEGIPQAQSARLAKATATAAASRVAAAAIQTHGAIGTTWDLDLHLLMRRAKTCELAFGSPERHLEAIAAELLGDVDEKTRRKRNGASTESIVDLAIDAESKDFIEEFREWLNKNVNSELKSGFRLRDSVQRRAALQAWQGRLADSGWAGIHWPKEYGGRSATFMQQVLYHTEIAVRNLPTLVGNRGLSQIGPTLIAHGTADQKSRFLERTRRADILWASGFSEREAGSDLASLRTRGAIEGDQLVINGHKIWTTSAHFSDFIYVLVRTGPLIPKHEGISCVMVPADSPGLSIRPIRRMTGISDFNECLFENVRVPLANVVGPINSGWQVMRTTLSHEHMTNFLGSQFKQAVTVGRVIDRLRERELQTGRVEAGLRLRVAQAWCNTQILRLHGLRNVVQLAAGEQPGAGGSMLKLFGQEEEQRLWELGVDVLGPDGLSWNMWTRGYLSVRGSTLGGGTSEIHRNKVAERVLGMPRDHNSGD